MSVNKVILIGHAGNTPENASRSGGDIASLSVATSDRYRPKDSQGWKEVTEWHRVSLFGQQAKFACSFVKKGDMVFVEGRIRTREFTDNKGIDRKVTEIVASTLQKLSKKDASKAPSGAPQQPYKPYGHNGNNIQSDDVPF